MGLPDFSELGCTAAKSRGKAVSFRSKYRLRLNKQFSRLWKVKRIFELLKSSFFDRSEIRSESMYLVSFVIKTCFSDLEICFSDFVIYKSQYYSINRQSPVKTPDIKT